MKALTLNETSPETFKPDTSAKLMQQQIWYQDTGKPSLWHRRGELIDTAAFRNAPEENDFYSDILGVVQIVFALETDDYPLRVKTYNSHR